MVKDGLGDEPEIGPLEGFAPQRIILVGAPAIGRCYTRSDAAGVGAETVA